MWGPAADASSCHGVGQAEMADDSRHQVGAQEVVAWVLLRQTLQFGMSKFAGMDLRLQMR